MTVAVLCEGTSTQAYKLDRNQVYKTCTRGSGPGGQHRNKVESVVVLVHKPTGITVSVDEERSQHKNAEIAWKRLEEKLADMHNIAQHGQLNDTRASQIGSGERGDKRRTYRLQDGTVKDDITGKKISARDLFKGYVGMLHR